MTIRIPDNFMGKPVEGAMERILSRTVSSQPVVQTPQNTNVSSTKDFWKISGVNYKNGIYDVDLAKSLLDNGNAKTQQDWANYSEQARKSGDFYVGDMPLYHSVFTALFNQKDKPESEEARKFIQKQMRDKYLLALTRVAYQPKGKDKIIHNFGTSEKYELEEDIIGKDRVVESKDSSALITLLGDGDINRIKSVYNWVNGTDIYIWRLNEKPKKSVDERVARFGAYSDWAYLYCNRDPDDSYSSLGVRLVAKK